MSDRFRVALTFDAEHPSRPLCPPGNADAILDSLNDVDGRATFFIQGRWASAYPSTAARIASDGHVVGNHSHFHAAMPLLSDDGLKHDVTKSEDVIRTITGTDPRPWFRCPFGAGHDDPRVASTLKGVGYTDVFWHVEVDDWEPDRSASDIADDALTGSRRHGDGAVVLLHTWPQQTAAALPRILKGLGDAGAQFVGIDELDDLP